MKKREVFVFSFDDKDFIHNEKLKSEVLDIMKTSFYIWTKESELKYPEISKKLQSINPPLGVKWIIDPHHYFYS